MFSFKRKNLFNFLFFIFFVVITFAAFGPLFNSYFEADEWFHFTHYFPLTREPLGVLLPIIKSVTDAGALSEGQHVVPIGEELFFLNVLFFGLNYKAYVFISLFLHALNSFLVFLFIRELLGSAQNKRNVLFSLLGGTFFALTAIPMHASIWAAFYGQNVLSITFFILSILFLKKAFSTRKKPYLFISSLFLLLDLLTKEIAVVLILIIPLMIFLEKGIFPLKSLVGIYSIPLAFFIPFRFILPVLYGLVNQWIETSMKLTRSVDAVSVSSGIDISLIIYRTISFPLSMLSQVFIPGATMLSVMHTISPLIYYLYPGEPANRAQNRLFFIYGPGQNFLHYLVAFGIIALLFIMMRKYKKDAKTILLGFLLIIASSLPLVFNVLRIQAWGTDLFDSRHYYMPSVGAAILFPFLLFFISEFIVTLFKRVRISINVFWVLGILFVGWFFNNNSVFQANLHTIVNVTGVPRREIITQLKEHLPNLPQKAVIYAETDGGGAYGTILPFQTSFPQILTIEYYDKNPLPNTFFNKFVLDGKAQGYMYSEGRGFGFYNTKKALSEALLENEFSIDDVYAFYYHTNAIKLDDITKSIRSEMREYLENSKENENWVTFQDATTKIAFRHPAGAQIVEEVSEIIDSKILKKFTIVDFSYSAQLSIVSILPTFDLNEMQIVVGGKVEAKKVYFDTYHFTDAVILTNNSETTYFVKFPDKLIKLVVPANSTFQDKIFEKIMGSLTVIE